VNGGVPGYGITEETALVTSLFPAVRPRIVLLTFCVNDLFAMMEQRSPERYARYEKERFSPLFFLSATTRHVFMRYFLFLYANGLSTPKINGIHPLQQESPDVKMAWAEYFSTLQSLAVFLHANNVELGIIVFPDFSQVVTGFDTPEQYFLKFSEEQGLPVLFLLNTFRDRRNEGAPFLIPDGHPNARAHQIIASAVADWLVGRTDRPPFPDIIDNKSQ
jgi:lysophospholipase L1-like esterase